MDSPASNFTLATSLQDRSSLLLVSNDFSQLVFPNSYHTINITEQDHWSLFFSPGSGLLDGYSEEATLRRSWVRELNIDMDVELPIAASPDGRSLAPSPPQHFKSFMPIERSPSPGLIPFHFNHYPFPPDPSLFPNLDRVTFLPSNSLLATPRPSSRPWPPHLLLQLQQRHLVEYKEEMHDPFAEFPVGEERTSTGWVEMNGEERLEFVVREGLLRESKLKKEALIHFLTPKGYWNPLEDEKRTKEVFDSVHRSDASVRKHFVYPPTLPLQLYSHSDTKHSTEPTLTLRIHLLALLKPLSIFYDVDSLPANIRFVNFPLEPAGVRRRFWHDILGEMGQQKEVWALVDYDEKRRKGGEIMLEILKGKDWAWVEEDGTVVGFEEGLGEDVYNRYDFAAAFDDEDDGDEDEDEDEGFSPNPDFTMPSLPAADPEEASVLAT